jgi:hypothetical protein
LSKTNGFDNQLDQGSYWKGIALALLCQFAYLFFVYELPLPEARTIGFMLFALVQLGYLFPLAVFYKKRDQKFTSNGIIIAGVLSILAAAAWFAYAVAHGTLPSITSS